MMSEEFGSDYIFVTDEDDKEYELEVLDTMEHNGQTYYALVSANTGEDKEEEEELIILKTVIEDGEELLSTLDDDDELDTVYELFMDRLYVEDEDED